ncbi:MAG: hypothetical protein AAGM84_05680 [Pseudomonadota bacterium]
MRYWSFSIDPDYWHPEERIGVVKAASVEEALAMIPAQGVTVYELPADYVPANLDAS